MHVGTSAPAALCKLPAPQQTTVAASMGQMVHGCVSRHDSVLLSVGSKHIHPQYVHIKIHPCVITQMPPMG